MVDDSRGFETEARSQGNIVVVSGMPRSGTSMMMQMLEAGGLEIHCDTHRAPDIDNPKGYYELEATRRLKTDSSFLSDACGKVVKVVAPLLPSLPAQYEYQVIFMERAMDEVLASQVAMLQRGDPKEKTESTGQGLDRAFQEVGRRVKVWLEQSNNLTTHFLEHRYVLESPTEASVETLRFLRQSGAFGSTSVDHAKMVSRMAAVVDPNLYRQRL